jgi:hypothetical protein
MHLAGHTDCQTHLIDTHDNHVIDPVWELYRLAHELTGGGASLLEWDAKIPPFPVVHAEILKARDYMDSELTLPSMVVHAGAMQSTVPNTPPHPATLVAAEIE